jgi:hypothetical protein
MKLLFGKNKNDKTEPKTKIDVINGNLVTIDTLNKRMTVIEDKTLATMNQVMDTAKQVLEFQQEYKKLADLVDKQIESVKVA